MKLRKELLKNVLIKPVFNKTNGQMNFSLKKGSLPKYIKDRLPMLKSIKLNMEDFEFY